MGTLTGKGLADKLLSGFGLSDKIFFSGDGGITPVHEWIFGSKSSYSPTEYVIPTWTADGTWGVNDVWLTPGLGTGA